MLGHAVGCNQFKAAHDRAGIHVCDRCRGHFRLHPATEENSACLLICQHSWLVVYELATYKLDRDKQSAYVTAAAKMQHARYT